MIPPRLLLQFTHHSTVFKKHSSVNLPILGKATPLGNDLLRESYFHILLSFSCTLIILQERFTKHINTINTMKNPSPGWIIRGDKMVKGVKVSLYIVFDKNLGRAHSRCLEQRIRNDIHVLLTDDFLICFVCPVCVLKDHCICDLLGLVVSPSPSFDKAVKCCFLKSSVYVRYTCKTNALLDEQKQIYTVVWMLHTFHSTGNFKTGKMEQNFPEQVP